MKNFLCALNFIYNLFAFVFFGWLLMPLMIAYLLISSGGGKPTFDVLTMWHSCIFYFNKKYNLRIPSF